MDDGRRQLVLLPGGLKEGDTSGDEPLPREALRVIPGGPGADLQAALEETVLEARRLRREIEERIARALDEPPESPSPP